MVVGPLHDILSLGTLGLQFLLLLSVVLFVVYCFARLQFLRTLGVLVSRRALLFSFLIALISALGSLYYSEIALLEPCVLCWYQRIVMYPLVLILGTALLLKRKDVFAYAMPLAVIGFLIGVYQYSIQFFHLNSPCSVDGVSCLTVYFVDFGYLTMPLMGVTAFTAMMVLLVLSTRLK